MVLEKLKNKPLAEAIFEIRWYTEQQTPSGFDANSQIILGRLFDRINSDYPIYEQLPFAAIPEQILDGLVRHQTSCKSRSERFGLGEIKLIIVESSNQIKP